MKEAAIKQLKADEGLRLTPYQDTLGNWTIGYGHLLENQHQDMTRIKWTLEQAEQVLSNDVDTAIQNAKTFFPDFMRLPLNARLVLINMAFNLGLPKLRQFKRFKLALLNRDYVTAAAEMLQSLWAKQVPNRAKRLADQMRKSKDYAA